MRQLCCSRPSTGLWNTHVIFLIAVSTIMAYVMTYARLPQLIAETLLFLAVRGRSAPDPTAT